MRLIELLPNFISELQIACEQLGRSDLTAQLETVELDNNTYSVETRVAQLRLRPGLKTDLEKKAEQDSGREPPSVNESLILRHRYGVKVETDNVGRLRKLTVAQGTDIAQALGKFSPLRQ
ncbi:MAG TPA: hypothetical protein VK753_08415 [Xanthomonadaceae bacterium]|nr:hypothetical protein [Xanthomonadaceae bacterium]